MQSREAASQSHGSARLVGAAATPMIGSAAKAKPAAAKRRRQWVVSIA